MNEREKSTPQDVYVDTQINQICDEFDHAWQQQPRPSWEDYCRRIKGERRTALARLLIAIDVDYRCHMGAPPTTEDYGWYLQLAGPHARQDLEALIRTARALQQLRTVRDAFDDSWSDGARPQIGDFLQQVAADSRPTLLRQLLRIDIDRRRGVGESPEEGEYLVQFPEHAPMIRQALAESVAISQSDVDAEMRAPFDSGDAKDATVTQIGRPGLDRLGPYVLLEKLGEGGMGVVYLAEHSERGYRLALKVLPRVDGLRLHKFKREFRSLADVTHPNVIGLQTLESDGDHWFFTMDLIEHATDFLSYVRPSGKLDAGRLWSALSQLVAGLTALHDHQIVHCDLKPSNVLVDGEGRLRLLDFGLVAELERRGVTVTEQHIAGTPAYMSPQQAAGEQATASSDWYAVGVMLYEALCGRRPFTGTLLALLRRKQAEDPPPLPPADDEVRPSGLSELCLKLLDRDPDCRPGASDILALIPDAARFRPESTPALAAREIIGRDAELAQLSAIAEEIKTSAVPITVFVEGRSGEGKTFLVEQFLKPLHEDPQNTILTGRCYDRESVPFKALDNLIDAVSSYLRSLPRERAALLLPREVAVLAELFPVLHRVQDIADAPRRQLVNLEEQQIRKRAFAVLRELLASISDRSRLLLFVDDLQWGDSDSAEALFDVLCPPEAPAVMFVGTCRSDEADRSPFLRNWNRLQHENDVQLDTRRVSVGPLDSDNCLELLAHLTGRADSLTRERVAGIVQEAEGNPYLLTEMASCFDADSATFRNLPLHEVIQTKTRRLPAESGDVLDMVAISGQSILWQDLCDSVSQSVDFAMLVQMRNMQLVRLITEESQTLVDTYHDKIRESVVSQLEVERRRQLHRQLAESLERSIPRVGLPAKSEFDVSADVGSMNRLYDLAYHYFEAGDPRAFDYQLRAGEAAIRSYAPEKAVQHLKKAEQILPGKTDAPTRYRLFERLGYASGRTHQVAEALRAFTKAVPVASSAMERAVVHQGCGDTYLRTGDFKTAGDSYDQALADLGQHRTKALPLVMIQTLWYLGRSELSWFLRPCGSEDDRQKAALAASVHLGHVHSFLSSGDMLRMMHSMVRIVPAAIRGGRVDLAAVGLAKIGLNYAMSSLQMPASRLIARAQRIAEESGDEAVEAELHGVIGMTLYISGNLAAAERCLREALNTLDRVGESYVRSLNYHILRHVHSVRGDSEREIETAGSELKFADPQSNCWGHYGMADAKARCGCLDEAHEHMRLAAAAIAEPVPPLTKTIMLHTHGFVLIQSSDYSQAADILTQSLDLMREKYLYVEFSTRVYPLLLESLVGPDWLTPRRDAQIRRARRQSKAARFFGWRFPNYGVHTLRIYGRLLCATGRPSRAPRYFEKSIKLARKLGAEYDLARALLDLAAVDAARRAVLRAEAVEILKGLKAVIPYAEKWQLGEDADESCVALPWDSGH